MLQRFAILSPTCVSVARTSSPGIDPFAEGIRLGELGRCSGNPANITRRPAATGVRTVLLPNTTPAGDLPGLEGSSRKNSVASEVQTDIALAGVVNSRTYFADEGDSQASVQPISRKASQSRKANFSRRVLVTPTVCGESCVGALRDPHSSSLPGDAHCVSG